MNQFIRPMKEDLEQLSHAQLGKNSKNSHKPPSSDGLRHQPAQSRQAGQHPKGGQPGHKGHSLVMHPSPDYVEDCRREGYCDCGLPLSEAHGIMGERRQQWDIPTPQMVVTEYRQIIATCLCGKVHAGEFPGSLPPYISYGARLKAYAVGLVQGHFISLSRVTEVIADQYGVKLSDGSVQRWISQASDNLTATYGDIRQTIRTGAAL
jgi:transposase